MSIDEELVEIERRLRLSENTSPLLLKKARLLGRAGRPNDAAQIYADILLQVPARPAAEEYSFSILSIPLRSLDD